MSYRQNAASYSEKEVEDLVAEIRKALDSGSNDEEHDALVSVANYFGIDPEDEYGEKAERFGPWDED